MDKHIEMPLCGFEAFKVLSRNYLDVEWHDSYHKIGELLEEAEMSPADVAENLMPKYEGEATDDCFKRLVEALEDAKEEAEKKKKKAEEEGEAAKMAETEETKKKAVKETAIQHSSKETKENN
ncbi:AAA-ATPase, partial [Cucurbita argyrosperma subsp. argyrosperma]